MTHDLAIVGAGPAGSWAAYTLARAGARVTIIDGSHPREKPCGGGVTGRALALVAGAIDTATLPATVIRAVRFTGCADGRAADLQATVPLEAHGLTSSSALVVASRAAFDARLLEAARLAGAELVAARVTGLAIDHAGLPRDPP